MTEPNIRAPKRPNPLTLGMGLLESMRPHQWVKNAFVLAPVVFSRNFDSPALLSRAALATLLFCVLSGAVYLLNDVLDVEADRAHPIKRNRPVASGRVPIGFAKGACGVLTVVALLLMFLLNHWAGIVAAGYFTMNVAYSMRLKHVAFIDVGIIATGFLLRILAGSLAIAVAVSAWLVACTFLLALYLALGKRKHELRSSGKARKQRAVLGRYNPSHVHLTMIVVGVLTVGTYSAYTLAPTTQHYFDLAWPQLALTIPFTAFGVARFFWLASTGDEGVSPTERMLKDKFFLLNLVAWIAVVMAVMYFG